MQSSTRSGVSRVVILTALLTPTLYLAACIAPAIDFGPQKGGPHGLHGVTLGFMALATGWWAVIAGYPVWLANPLLLLAWVLLCVRRLRAAAVVGALAFGLGVFYLAFPLGTPLVGAYLWVGSAGVLVVGGVLASIRRAGRRLLTSPVRDPEPVGDPARILGIPACRPALWTA